MSQEGLVVHTNHYVEEHPGKKDNTLLRDSKARLSRMSMLAKVSNPDVKSIRRMLEDQRGCPTAINRQRTEEDRIETLLSIVMDLGKCSANVRMKGRRKLNTS